MFRKGRTREGVHVVGLATMPASGDECRIETAWCDATGERYKHLNAFDGSIQPQPLLISPYAFDVKLYCVRMSLTVTLCFGGRLRELLRVACVDSGGSST